MVNTTIYLGIIKCCINIIEIDFFILYFSDRFVVLLKPFIISDLFYPDSLFQFRNIASQENTNEDNNYTYTKRPCMLIDEI